MAGTILAPLFSTQRKVTGEANLQVVLLAQMPTPTPTRGALQGPAHDGRCPQCCQNVGLLQIPQVGKKTVSSRRFAHISHVISEGVSVSSRFFCFLCCELSVYVRYPFLHYWTAVLFLLIADALYILDLL